MKIAVLMLLASLLCGCAGTSRLVRMLAKDPATAYIAVQMPYGNLKVIRTNPGTNTTVSVTAEGTVTVTRSEK